MRIHELVLFVLVLRLSVGCLMRREGQSPAKMKPLIDLVDEKDDGQTLTLGDSENIIVPPEEDEDPTDDQAPDIDKKEDLEDLGRVQVLHLDNEVYELDLPYEVLNQSSVHNSNLYTYDHGSFQRLNPAFPGKKNDGSEVEFESQNISKPQRPTGKPSNPQGAFPHIQEKPELKLKSGIVRHSTSKGNRGADGTTASRCLLVMIVVLASFVSTFAAICVAIFIKIRLMNRSKTCKVSKVSLMENEMSRMV